MKSNEKFHSLLVHPLLIKFCEMTNNIVPRGLWAAAEVRGVSLMERVEQELALEQVEIEGHPLLYHLFHVELAQMVLEHLCHKIRPSEHLNTKGKENEQPLLVKM